MQNITSDIFQRIGDFSNDVYFIFSLDTVSFQYLSPAFETVWNVPVKNVLNDPAFLFKTIDPQDVSYVMDRYQNVAKSVNQSTFEFRIIGPDQSKKNILVKLYPLLENGEIKLIAGIAEDFSVIKKNIFYSEKINARKDSMLEILVHDLKGPLGMISMMASSLKRDLERNGNENMLQAVKFIQDMCKRNIALIRNLVNSEFLESAEVDIRKERADLVWGINDIIQNYKKSEDAISKTFTLTSSSEKLYIQMDSLKLMQVFNNLISNAIKFTPDNGVIAVDIEEKEAFVLITVRDNGIGIPADLQPHLFDKFTRARRTGLRGEEPVGLGMSIIKMIVELHDGKIWFESKENIGSTFYIQIPK